MNKKIYFYLLFPNNKINNNFTFPYKYIKLYITHFLYIIYIFTYWALLFY